MPIKNIYTDLLRSILIFVSVFISFRYFLNYGLNFENTNNFFNNLLFDFERFLNIQLLNITFLTNLYLFVYSAIATSLFVSSFWYMNPAFYKETSLDIFIKILFYFSLFNTSFFYLTRLYDLSRALLIIYLLFSSILIFSYRSNSKLNKYLFKRPSLLNFIYIEEKGSESSRTDTLLKKLKYSEKIDSITYESTLPIDQITEIEKIKNIDFYILQTSSPLLDSELNKLIQFNKAIVSVNNNFEILNTFASLTKKVFIEDDEYYIINPNSQSGIQLIIKRLMDIFFSSVFIILLAPIVIFLSIYIYLIDFKNPIVSIPRTGKNSRLFKMYKIRTMVFNAHKDRSTLEEINERQGPLFKIKNDPRLLKNTNWIRKYSLDELPQFINVLKGDMSIVGPRPLFKEDLEKYKSEDFIRQSVTPGITGLLQIKDRETVDFEIWKKYDQEYIRSWSLFLDLKIMFLTPIKVFSNKST